MSTDREVLSFVHDRLVKVYGESEIVGYMHKLRSIIASIPADQESYSACANSLDELRRKLPRMDALKREHWLTRWARRHVEFADEKIRALPEVKP